MAELQIPEGHGDTTSTLKSHPWNLISGFPLHTDIYTLLAL